MLQQPTILNAVGQAFQPAQQQPQQPVNPAGMFGQSPQQQATGDFGFFRVPVKIRDNGMILKCYLECKMSTGSMQEAAQILQTLISQGWEIDAYPDKQQQGGGFGFGGGQQPQQYQQQGGYNNNYGGGYRRNYRRY